MALICEEEKCPHYLNGRALYCEEYCSNKAVHNHIFKRIIIKVKEIEAEWKKLCEIVEKGSDFFDQQLAKFKELIDFLESQSVPIIT